MGFPAIPPGVPPTPTVIVGGGPVGLTVALGLVARGWKEVVVVERAAALVAPDSHRTYAMGVSHRGQDVLAGVEAAVTAAAAADAAAAGSGHSNDASDAGAAGGGTPAGSSSSSSSDGDRPRNDGGCAVGGGGDRRRPPPPRRAGRRPVDVVEALRRHGRTAPTGLRVWIYAAGGGGSPAVYTRPPLPGRRPSWLVRRRRLQQVLATAAAAAGVRVQLGTTVVGVTWGPQPGGGGDLPVGVHLAPTDGGDEAETLWVGLLLGCDGCSSAVRAAVGALPAAPGAAVASEAAAPPGVGRRDAAGWPFSAACRPVPGGEAPVGGAAARAGVRVTTGGVRVEVPSGFGTRRYPYRTQGWHYKAVPLPVGHPFLGHPPHAGVGAATVRPAAADAAQHAPPALATPLPDVVVAPGATWVGGAPRSRRRQFRLTAFRTGDDDAGRVPLATVAAPPDHALWAVRSAAALRALFAENFPTMPGGGGAALLPDDKVAAEIVAAPVGTLPRMLVP